MFVIKNKLSLSDRRGKSMHFPESPKVSVCVVNLLFFCNNLPGQLYQGNTNYSPVKQIHLVRHRLQLQHALCKSLLDSSLDFTDVNDVTDVSYALGLGLGIVGHASGCNIWLTWGGMLEGKGGAFVGVTLAERKNLVNFEIQLESF